MVCLLPQLASAQMVNEVAVIISQLLRCSTTDSLFGAC
jgi:hypothetical protein